MSMFTCQRCGAQGDPPKCDHFAQAWTREEITKAHKKLQRELTTMARICEACGELVRQPQFMEVSIRLLNPEEDQQDAGTDVVGDYCDKYVSNGKTIADLLAVLKPFSQEPTA